MSTITLWENGRDPWAARDLPEVDVALVAEGTYPFVRGGVSSIMHELVTGRPDLRFGVIHVAWDTQSPHAWAYPMPSNVAWVQAMFLSPAAVGSLKLAKQRSVQLPLIGGWSRAKAARELIDAACGLGAGGMQGFRELFAARLDPARSRRTLWGLIDTREFKEALVERFRASGLSVSDIFWIHRELLAMAFSLTYRVFPKARLYHAHTQGYAGLAAMLASWQHDARFLLSEHALYLDDVMSQLDKQEACVAGETSVPAGAGAGAAHLKHATVHQSRVAVLRAWFDTIGRAVYGAADDVTYLYPRASVEARRYGLGDRPVRLVPNGVAVDSFAATRAERRAWRAAKPAGAPVVFGLLGRLVPVKGVLWLIEAVAKLLASGDTLPPFQVLITGRDDELPEYDERCRARIAELGLAPWVQLVGQVDARAFLARTDWLVLPSESEAFPMALLEGMAAGLPAIATRVGAVPEIAHGSGLVVAPRDPDELASALKAALDDPSLADRLGAVAHARVSTDYTLQGMIAGYGDAYARLLSTRLLQCLRPPRAPAPRAVRSSCPHGGYGPPSSGRRVELEPRPVHAARKIQGDRP
jgi:glycosyltransferase involved in cell wall biosynthesis